MSDKHERSREMGGTQLTRHTARTLPWPRPRALAPETDASIPLDGLLREQGEFMERE